MKSGQRGSTIFPVAGGLLTNGGSGPPPEPRGNAEPPPGGRSGSPMMGIIAGPAIEFNCEPPRLRMRRGIFFERVATAGRPAKMEAPRERSAFDAPLEFCAQ